MADNTGLSWVYRFAWRMEYIFVTFTGPAHQSGPKDPKARLRLDRARRVASAYASAGKPIPAEVQGVIDRVGAKAKKANAEAGPDDWRDLHEFKRD